MTLAEWEALSDEQRAKEIATWDIYGRQGYWFDLFREAVSELRGKLKEDPTVQHVFFANNHGTLEISVATSLNSPSLPWLDKSFRGTYRALPVRQLHAEITDASRSLLDEWMQLTAPKSTQVPRRE